MRRWGVDNVSETTKVLIRLADPDGKHLGRLPWHKIAKLLASSSRWVRTSDIAFRKHRKESYKNVTRKHNRRRLTNENTAPVTQEAWMAKQSDLSRFEQYKLRKKKKQEDKSRRNRSARNDSAAKSIHQVYVNKTTDAATKSANILGHGRSIDSLSSSERKCLEEIRTEIAERYGLNSLHKVFLRCDCDRNGFVDGSELQERLKEWNLNCRSNAIALLIDVCGTHKDPVSGNKGVAFNDLTKVLCDRETFLSQSHVTHQAPPPQAYSIHRASAASQGWEQKEIQALGGHQWWNEIENTVALNSDLSKRVAQTVYEADYDLPPEDAYKSVTRCNDLHDFPNTLKRDARRWDRRNRGDKIKKSTLEKRLKIKLEQQKRRIASYRQRLHHRHVVTGQLRSHMDLDGSSKITFDNFARGVCLVGIRPTPSNEDMQVLFETFDTAKANHITWSRLKRSLEKQYGNREDIVRNRRQKSQERLISTTNTKLAWGRQRKKEKRPTTAENAKRRRDAARAPTPGGTGLRYSLRHVISSDETFRWKRKSMKKKQKEDEEKNLTCKEAQKQIEKLQVPKRRLRTSLKDWNGKDLTSTLSSARNKRDQKKKWQPPGRWNSVW